jgi:hypothetical protein
MADASYPSGLGAVGETVSVRLVTLTIVGFILGAFAAGGIGVSVIREVRSLDDATSLPQQNIARADGYHVGPSETLISSVALVPIAATFGDDGFSISYDLMSIAPSLGTEGSVAGQSLYPKRWLIEAIGGEFEGIQESPDEAAVVFPLMSGGSIGQIDTVRVVEAFLPAPFDVQVSVSAAEPQASVIAGVEVLFAGTTTSEGTTTIEVRVVADEDSARDIQVVGNGSGWISAVATGDTVTLTRASHDAATDFDLVVSGTSWVAIDGEFTVNIGAGDE